jgi:hypothetical protein
MSTNESGPPSRVFTLQISVSSTDHIPQPLVVAFAHCCAEAQMLEHAIKSAITKDVRVFAKASDQISFLEILEKIALGQAKDIAIGTSSRSKIVACVGFFDFVKMQWVSFSGRKESELGSLFKDAVNRRNRLAHQLLAEVFHSTLSVEDALTFLKDSKERFFELRKLITTADVLSSKMGGVASDGRSLPRFKTTS